MNIQSVAFLLLFQFLCAFDPALESSKSSPPKESPERQLIEKAGAGNVVFKSTDGGETWQDISDKQSENLREDDFDEPAHVYGGQFLQKIKGTGFWMPMYTNFQPKEVRAVFEATGGAAFIGCSNGLFRSTDSGKIWKQVYTEGWVMKLAESKGVLMATSQRGIIRSTDDGENWESVVNEGGVGIDIASIQGGFAAISYSPESDTRRVRTSYDGGKTWQPIDTGLPASLSIASITEVGEYLFCGHPTGVFRSPDKGKTWKLILPSVGSKVFNLSVSGNVIYAIPKNGGC